MANKKNDSPSPQARYGLPHHVEFCSRCVLSNQRPNSTLEFKHTTTSKKETTAIVDGVCDACRFADLKDQEIDWEQREQELLALCDRYRSSDGTFDCIVPGSGGKDSRFTSWILKHKYGMNPLTVTWPPHIYTEIGWKNFQSWIDAGFENILYSPNGKTHRYLTKLAFKNLLHPFQPFIFGQRFIGVRMAIRYGIPLVFHGESPSEYGNKLEECTDRTFRKKYFYSDLPTGENVLGGVKVKDLIKDHNLSLNDLQSFLPLTESELKHFPLEYHFLGYYLKWDPQEIYYQAVEHTGFEANPERTEGTYSKYASLDDRIDGFHYYTTYIKFGLGRATYDAAQEIRNKKITREEGIALVRRYDGEFPSKYFEEILDYMDISKEEFWTLVDNARSPHLWEKSNGQWELRHAVFK